MTDLHNVLDEYKKELNEIHYDFFNDYDLDDLEIYPTDRVQEFCDGRVDLYNKDLMDWVRNEPNAVDYLELVVSEGLIDTKDYDFMRHIQCAQYEFYNNQFYDDSMVEMLSIAFIVEKLIDDGVEAIIMTEEDLYNVYSTSDIEEFYSMYETLKRDLEDD